MDTTMPAVAPQTVAAGSVTPANAPAAMALLRELVDLGIGFKLRDVPFIRRLDPVQVRDLVVDDLPAEGRGVEAVVGEVIEKLLPLCKNEASPFFAGFGDTGDDIAALAGGIVDLFTQQNLINQSFDSPAATFTEIAVLRWLRELIGYPNPPVSQVRTVWDVGGLVTTGGTMSNTIGMMLAREKRCPDTMHRGVEDSARLGIVVPRGIGHYSVKSACTWIGAGSNVVEVPTRGYRYDLRALEQAVRANRDRLMAVVAYAGDSRTQTVDDLRSVAEVVRDVDQRIWLHADACWGLVAAFSDTLRHLIDGITGFDSVTVDPHKVMAIPYSLSALLVRDPADLRLVSSYSDLIMQEEFAFGQVTPFLGTKGWGSLKLWAMMRARGKRGLAAIAEHRIEVAARFAELVDASPRLLRLHDPDLAAVAFCYLPAGAQPTPAHVERINEVNLAIHRALLSAGRWHLHTFTLPDDTGRICHGALLQPLRFMANNPRITETHLRELIDHVHQVGATVESEVPE